MAGWKVVVKVGQMECERAVGMVAKLAASKAVLSADLMVVEWVAELAAALVALTAVARADHWAKQKVVLLVHMMAGQTGVQ